MEDVSKILRDIANDPVGNLPNEHSAWPETLKALADRCERMEDLVRKSVIRPLKHCPNCNYKLT